MGAAVMLLLYNIFKTLRHAPPAAKDPWNAFTLEWMAGVPPPEKNFDQVPLVSSRRPFWDVKNPSMRDYD